MVKLKKLSVADTVSFAGKSATAKTKWEEVFVERWVDYSSKYGVAFLLSNQTVGVYYKDASVIASRLASKTFTFVDSKHQKSQVEYQFSNCNQTLSDELQSKLSLFYKFRAYLTSDSSNNCKRSSFIKPHNHADLHQSLIFLKRWRKRPKAIMFCLSSDLI